MYPVFPGKQYLSRFVCERNGELKVSRAFHYLKSVIEKTMA